MDNKESRKVTKHTWIDENDDIKIANKEEGIKESSLSWDETRAKKGDPGAIYGATRIVEKTKKPYEGFITDKQVEDSKEAIKIDDRSTRILSADERAELFKMKVYPYPTSSSGAADSEDSKQIDGQNNARAKSAKRKSRTVSINDSSKFKRFIVVIVVACLLLAASVTLAVMKAKTAKLPKEAEDLTQKTTELLEENAAITEEAAEYGDYEEQKELKASWERLKENLTGETSE